MTPVLTAILASKEGRMAVGLAERCGSTQDLARAIVAEIEQEKASKPAVANSSPRIFAVAAKEQTQGRGRGGATWSQAGVDSGVNDVARPDTPPAEVPWHGSLGEAFVSMGNVMPLTFVVPSALMAIPPTWIPAVTGCAVVDALRQTASFLLSSFPDLPPPDTRADEALVLKWPNDLLLKGEGGKYRKVGGILCETSVQGGAFSHFLIGVGLNFFDAPALDTAASWFRGLFSESLSRKAERSRLNKFLGDKGIRAAVLERFAQCLERELLEYWTVPRLASQLRGLTQERSVPLGTILSVNKGTHIGRFAGLAENGGLILEGQVEPVLAGDVTVYEGVASLTGLPKASTQDAQGNTVPGQSDSEGPEKQEGSQVTAVLLDFGNTNIHWEVAFGKETRASGDAPWEAFADDADLKRAPDTLRPLALALVERKHAKVQLVYTSVVEAARTKRYLVSLEALLRHFFPEMKPERLEVSSSSLLAGTALAGRYDATTLGPDRALRFVFCAQEAARKGFAVATVGAGTAFTVECVSPSGEILESLITPGWQMGLDALHEKTARLPDLDPETRARPHGRPWSTEDSMQRGAALPVAAVLNWLVRDSGVGLIVLSGGSAEALAELFAQEMPEAAARIEVRPGLERSVLRARVASGSLASGWALNKACLAAEEAASATSTATSALNPEAPADDGLANIDAYRTDGRAPPESVLRSMLKARVVKAKDIGLEPRREDFRKLGVRIENLPEDGNERIDRYLAERFKFHNRDTWQARIEAGEVLVQRGTPQVTPPEPPAAGLNRVKDTYRLKNLDQIWLFHPPEYEPDHIDTCEVVFDDNDTVVFSKPGNLVVHASGLYGKNTFLEVARRMGYPDASPVHRLDRETSGALVCARSQAARHALSRAFRNGTMNKMYIAVTKAVNAEGECVPDRFSVAHPIGPALASRIRLKLWIDHPDAQEARTHFVRLAHVDGFDLMACFPQTGRTNQIRIHLLAAGQWIVGDKMYHPDEEVFLQFYEEGLTPWVYERVLFPRHLLHNAGIEATGTGEADLPTPRGGIWNNPVMALFTSDMLQFEPLVKLMREAGIPEDHDGQTQALRTIFRRHVSEDFQEDRCYR